MSTQMKRVRDVRAGDIIQWAGHICAVTAAYEPMRQKNQHKVSVWLDLDVPGLPPRKGVHYWDREEVVCHG